MILLPKRLKPLCFLSDGRLLTYRFSNFYILDPHTFDVIEKYSVSLGFKEKYLSRIKILYRFFRLGIRNAVQINNETVIIFVNKRFYELNLQSMELKPGFVPETGVRTLNISVINNVPGFDNMVVFGEYIATQEKPPISIYRRMSTDNWSRIYTFPANHINHIHNIVPDVSNLCVWIFTGDFDEAATIWRATDNFEKVERVVSGDQIYRGCVAFPVDNGVLYATDSPFSQNSIRFLHNNGGKWDSEHIFDINGSCIYGCKVNDKYVFSTAVEPDGRDAGFMKLLFGRRRGYGIKNLYSYIYTGNMDVGFREVYRDKKDMCPFIFQFGTFMFPNGLNNTEYILAEHISTKKYDCSAVAIPLETNLKTINKSWKRSY